VDKTSEIDVSFTGHGIGNEKVHKRVYWQIQKKTIGALRWLGEHSKYEGLQSKRNDLKFLTVKDLQVVEV